MPYASWPGDTFFNDENDFFFNDEAVQVLHQPNAHADGDSDERLHSSNSAAARRRFAAQPHEALRLVTT
jgi:hypothetical protein